MLQFHQKWRIGWTEGATRWVVDSDGWASRFDLARDPGEEQDLAASDPEATTRADRGLTLLRRLQAREATPDSGLAASLKALGYTED
jgi:hypothetical protein